MSCSIPKPSMDGCLLNTLRRSVGSGKFKASMTLSTVPEQSEFSYGTMQYAAHFNLSIVYSLTREEQQEQMKFGGGSSDPRLNVIYKGVAYDVMDASKNALQAFLDNQFIEYKPDNWFPMNQFNWRKVHFHIEGPNEDIVLLMEQVIKAKVGQA